VLTGCVGDQPGGSSSAKPAITLDIDALPVLPDTPGVAGAYVGTAGGSL